jgi:predicted nucleotidyltransferase
MRRAVLGADAGAWRSLCPLRACFSSALRHMDDSKTSVSPTLSSLRAAAAPVFSKPDFSDVRWAGVFGSFAREAQTDFSDIDVLVFRDPPAKRVSHSLNPLFLEEELPKVWRRDVDVVYTTGEEFRGYISVEAPLCSRTLFGSDEDDEVMRLRGQAKDILETGYAKFSTILDAIQKTQKKVTGVTAEVCTPPLHLIPYNFGG